MLDVKELKEEDLEKDNKQLTKVLLDENRLDKVVGGSIEPTNQSCPLCGYFPLMDDTYTGYCYCPAAGCSYRSRNS